MIKRVLCIDGDPRSTTMKGEKLPKVGVEYEVDFVTTGGRPPTPPIPCYAISSLNNPAIYVTEQDRFIDAEPTPEEIIEKELELTY